MIEGFRVWEGSSFTKIAEAIVQVESTTQFAIPVPRMTTAQRNALTGMVTGAWVFDTTLNTPYFYNGSGWVALGSSVGSQPLDATLTALAAYNTNGLLTQTAADTFTGRTITGTANRLTVTNGNGVSGNPTLTIPDSAQLNIAKLVNLTTNGFLRTISGDGTLQVVNTADFGVAGGSVTPQVTTGAELIKNEAVTNKQNYYSLDYDQSTIEYGQFVWLTPSNWNASTITFAVVWTAASGSGDVIWTLEARAYANDDAIDQSWGTGVDVTDTLTATGDLDISPTSSAVTIAGTLAAGNPVIFRISRKASNGSDTLNADAKLLGVKINYGIA